MTVLFSTLLRISPSGVRAPLLTITPPSKRSSAFGVSSTPAAAPSSCSFASRAAMRTAGPIDAVVTDPRDRTVRVIGVADTDLYRVKIDAELIRADLGDDGPRSGPDVLRSGGQHDGSVRIHVDRRVCGWPAASSPDLRGHSDPSASMRGGTADPAGAAALPSDLRGADAIALEEMLVRIFLATHRVLRRAGVFAPKGQRVDPHLLGEFVHRRRERQRSFNVARRTKSGERPGVGDDLVRLRGQIRDVVERVRRTGGIGDRRTLAHVGPRDVLDRRDSAGLAADPELLQGRGAVSGGDVLLFAREDAADWPYQLHREERSDDRVLPRPAL